MKKEKLLNFNFPTLLRLGDLDIRRMAEERPSETVDDYFSLLSRFVDLAPKAAEALAKVAGLKSERKDLVLLGEMKTLLEELGYSKLIPVIDSILSAGEKGNMEFAADCAKRSVGDFHKLHKRTETAIISDVSEDTADTSVHGVTNRGQPLIEVLRQVDSEESSRKMRVLAVDDSSSTLKIISSSLKDQYKVFTLSDPAQIERFLQQVTPELFLLDYKMPEVNGFELVPIIRSFEEHKDTPIIFLTSQGTKSTISAAAMLGAVDFMVKPFDSSTLHDKIAKHIVRKKLF